MDENNKETGEQDPCATINHFLYSFLGRSKIWPMGSWQKDIINGNLKANTREHGKLCRGLFLFPHRGAVSNWLLDCYVKVSQIDLFQIFVPGFIYPVPYVCRNECPSQILLSLTSRDGSVYAQLCNCKIL